CWCISWCGRRLRRSGAWGCRGVEAQLCGASWPCAPALSSHGALCNDNLVFASCLVCGRSELATAVSLPGGSRELQAAVVAVSGADAPVSTRLALCETVPVRSRGCGCGWCH